nr:hypothetical protein BaRGS_017587 [Batillaria attramentaria]
MEGGHYHPHKEKDPAKKTSYRPISLLSCLGKTLERMINKRLMWHLESNNLITKEQTAFRKNRSTVDQLVYLAQSIENAFQEKKKVVATFIDLSKAFDKVWTDGLLLKLLTAGIAGRMFNWIKSFLCHSTARVKLDSSLSHTVKIREGVPQGGVISPTLFVVFINDISSSLSRHISRALHADDFAMWNASESTSSATVRMQEALNTTSKWATDWCVTINSQKTVATYFSLSNTKETLRLTINNQQIPQEDTPTYLGTKLDKKLTWNPHIREMEKRATKRLSLMKKLAGTKWGANSSILKRVYIGNVRPVMEYGAAAWATAAKSNTSSAQAQGLLCEEAGNNGHNVKYCGYCAYHYKKLKKDANIKIIPAFKPIPADNATPDTTPEKGTGVPQKSEREKRVLVLSKDKFVEQKSFSEKQSDEKKKPRKSGADGKGKTKSSRSSHGGGGGGKSKKDSSKGASGSVLGHHNYASSVFGGGPCFQSPVPLSGLSAADGDMVNGTSAIFVPPKVFPSLQNSKPDDSPGGSGFPASLEQLLERQWDQGAQFLMDQSQHFDSQ